MTILSDWLTTELAERGWSMRELARRSGISTAQISDVISGNANPGVKFCQAIAKGLGVPPTEIFRLAGHLPARSNLSLADVPRLQEFVERFARLPRQSQDRIIDAALLLVEAGEVANNVETPRVPQSTEQTDADNS